MVSSWVENKLGTVKLVKVAQSGLVKMFCVSFSQRERALRITCLGIRPLTCIALRCKVAFESRDYWGGVKC